MEQPEKQSIAQGRRRRKRAISGFIVGAACFAAWQFLSSEGEPVYKGKRLTQWVDEYREQRLAKPSTVDYEKREAAKEAIRQIGTNAIPTLLTMVAAKDSRYREWWAETVNSQSFIEYRIPLAAELRAKSSFGFGPLQSMAQPAVPALVVLLSDPDKHVRAQAAHTLSLIGPDAKEAVPALVRLLEQTGDGWGPVILNCMHALGAIHSDAETVVPLLRQYVSGSRTDWNYGAAAEKALRQFDMAERSVANSTVPRLGVSGDSDDSTSEVSTSERSTNE